jgi:hypothetical protein
LPDTVRDQVVGRIGKTGEPSRELVLSLDDGLDAMLAQIIQAMLEAEGGNKAHAAARLKVSLRTVQRHVPLATLMEPPIFRMMEPGGELNDRRKWCHVCLWESSGVRHESACGGGAAAWAW